MSIVKPVIKTGATIIIPVAASVLIGVIAGRVISTEKLASEIDSVYDELSSILDNYVAQCKKLSVSPDECSIKFEKEQTEMYNADVNDIIFLKGEIMRKFADCYVNGISFKKLLTFNRDMKVTHANLKAFKQKITSLVDCLYTTIEQDQEITYNPHVIIDVIMSCMDL